ncbi:hypothetical protein HDU76_000291 [Blyttiomyces sp. JEL0837]|nr:hypothetical protein HDU76_000291 [Blyttiomyces sp. JEL0837]
MAGPFQTSQVMAMFILICLLLIIFLLTMATITTSTTFNTPSITNNNKYASSHQSAASHYSDIDKQGFSGSSVADVMSKIMYCDYQCVSNEPSFDVFPGEGDQWSGNFLKKARMDVAIQQAPLSCDLSQMELPLEFVQITSGDAVFKAALHPPGKDVHVSETMRKHGVPFEAGFHPLFRAALNAVAKLQNLNKGDKQLILDAGGNIGAHSLFFAKLGHETHTFEPFIKNMRLLRCSAQINKFTNLFLQRVALSDTTTAKKMCLNAPEGNVGGTTLSEECGGFNHKEANNYETSTDIRSVRLDDYWRVVLDGRRPALMKIDVEGYEVKAFLGADETLTKAAPYFIFSELYEAKLKDTGYSPLDYVNLMTKYGYTTYVTGKMIPYVHGKEGSIVDVVFVHKDVLDKFGKDLKKILS